MTRDELFLLEEMMPIWKEYVSGFVFMVDNATDGTYEFLMDNREKYNIHSVLETNLGDDDFRMESVIRQRLYDEGLKYGSKIICLDTDEYLDGSASPESISEFLGQHPDVTFLLSWVQYADKNNIRVDPPWNPLPQRLDRICNYTSRIEFKEKHMHSEHIPNTNKRGAFDPNNLFVAHLQWIDKPTVAVKQYYWKIIDYVNNLKEGVEIISPVEYDKSVNNFSWTLQEVPYQLKVSPDIYKKVDLEKSFKYREIKRLVKEHNIPNLNDWGMNIHG